MCWRTAMSIIHDQFRLQFPRIISFVFLIKIIYSVFVRMILHAHMYERELMSGQ